MKHRPSMALKCLIMAAMVAGCATPSHGAPPKLTPKVDGDTLRLFSTSDKPVRCEAVVRFTYYDTLSKKRESGWTSFGYFTTKPGKDVEVNHFSDETATGIIIDGDVVGGCNNDGSPRESEKNPK